MTALAEKVEARAYRDVVDAVNRATDRQIAEAEREIQRERERYAPAFRAFLRAMENDNG
jgi:hypothetical protein